MPRFEIIAFDADDTLWHNERLYVDAQDALKQLLAPYASPEAIAARLYQTEINNLSHFGYGIKAFALSMIETALSLTEGQISGQEIEPILNIAKTMLTADVELLDHVAETIQHLSTTHALMVITKGDLRDQEIKVEKSGLAQHFQHIEIISDKSRQRYADILARYTLAPEQFLMVGNSLRSDILPVMALGASAVYIPYQHTWAHEAAEPPAEGETGYYQLEHLGLLPALLKQIECKLR